MKKFFIALIMALSVTMIFNVKVEASDDPLVTPTQIPDRISSLVSKYGSNAGHVNIRTIFDYYNNTLSSDQKKIVNYLIGMYNYTYISARGFQYNNINSSDQFVNRLLAFGSKYFDLFLDNGSRLDSYMQQYLSAIISYAGTINSSFAVWLDYINAGVENEEYLYIPFTKDSLNSWTNYYDDPSIYGVLNWGTYVSNWVSGNYYDFSFTGQAWADSTNQNRYNNFLINNSPVIYSDIVNGTQYVYSLKDINIFDSLYILRSNSNSYSYFRFGYENSISNDIIVNGLELRVYGGGLRANNISNTLFGGIYNTGTSGSLSSVIEFAFNHTPFYSYSAQFKYFYPFISHVFLVDDLNLLSNKEEIFDIETLDIIGNDPWIQLPDDDYNWKITLDPLPDLPDNLVKNNGDPVNDSDLVQQVVNNTVINNYDIVAPGSIINVPVDWLEGESNYLEYTNNAALPFFVMVGDIFNSLGEIRIFIIAVLIIGLAGGVLVKFLL